ncbi:hypothetical protein DRV85_12500 [Rhodosalinus halophilus]|uniref:Uncharacterized protein n=1 Tax=Rhodosalinus halophilus TaxID=2259333 RepID=A0A365U7G6_9RHOB|nr:hypothetical protein [Rhodosalinus halophilus]RBI84258.1 hypothetical protein DRV85_12500 [Rhodosalinus halophilus]
MPHRSPFLALFLALTLVVTAQAAAVARGQPAAAGAIVICAGGGLVTVRVDSQGDPVGPPHVCPDAVAGLAAPAPPEMVAKAHPALFAAARAFAALPAPLGHRQRPSCARDPPRRL